MILTKTAMKELRTHLAFTQVRFHCSKQKGRTFHVTTAANSSGEAVVRYFSGQTDIHPASCGSFIVMSNDNSKLARTCDKWGAWYYAGKWGYASGAQGRLYNHVLFVRRKYHWVLEAGGRMECDDAGVGASIGDFWKVFVR